MVFFLVTRYLRVIHIVQSRNRLLDGEEPGYGIGMFIIVKFASIMAANKRRLRSASSRGNDKLILRNRRNRHAS